VGIDAEDLRRCDAALCEAIGESEWAVCAVLLFSAFRERGLLRELKRGSEVHGCVVIDAVPRADDDG
ncbi:MAG: hypothetical protein WA815_21020, partial [Terracidiphilus sp.]